MKSRRDGYPAIFLRSGAATQTLVAIAAHEPATVADIQEINTVTNGMIALVGKRLVRQGLIRRYARARPGKSPVVEHVLEPNHPQANEIRLLVRCIAAMNGFTVPELAPALPTSRRIAEKQKTTEKRLFRLDGATWKTLFGAPKRSLTLLLLALTGELDASTICRVVRAKQDGARYKFLDPIEDDGLVVRRPLGAMLMYSLADAPWTEPFRRLAEAIANDDEAVRSMSTAARALMLAGGHSKRKNLRGHLGVADHAAKVAPGPTDPGRRINGA
jgi:hypothetical protein